MSRRVYGGLTPDLLDRLSGVPIESLARTALVLCTVDPNGWPHPSMLSYFEVAARDPHTIRLAVYNGSRTCANMRERGKATLILVDEGLVCYVRGAAAEVAPAMRSAPYNAALNLQVEQVVFDEPPPDLEPGAFVTSGIIYTARTADALARAHAVLAELLGL